jgi:hypothetical protein
MPAEFSMEADFSEWHRELDRLRSPSVQTIAQLEIMLNNLFGLTQTDVHVITGSLRGSGKTETSYQGGVWEGKIGYGGGSPGYPKDPVEYANYEQARGPDHDFFKSMPIAMALLDDIVTGHLRGT